MTQSINIVGKDDDQTKLIHIYDNQLSLVRPVVSWESSSSGDNNKMIPSQSGSSIASDIESRDSIDDFISPEPTPESDTSSHHHHHHDDTTGKRFFPPGSVRFDTASTVTSTTDDSTVGQLSPINLSTLSGEHMRNIIRQMECEISAERAIRRKKERSIVKLAKQLKTCVHDSEAKERQVLMMAKTICELEELLHNHHRELAEDQEKIRRVCRESEERLGEYEGLVQSLRKQLFACQIEIDSYRLKLHNFNNGNELPIVLRNDSSTNYRNSFHKNQTNRMTRWNQACLTLAVTGVAIGISAVMALHNRKSTCGKQE